MLSVIETPAAHHVVTSPGAGWHASALFGDHLPYQAISEWKSGRWFVLRRDLTPDVCDALALVLPELQVPPAYAGQRARLAAMRCFQVGAGLRDELLGAGVRVWSIYHTRISSQLLVAARGGPSPPVQFHTCSIRHLIAEGWDPDGDDRLIDRVLRAVSEDALDTYSVLEACRLDLELSFRWPADSLAERRELARVAELARDLDPADLYDGVRYPLSELAQDMVETDLVTRLGHGVPARTLALVAAMQAPDGPPAIAIDGFGEFRRTHRPAVEVPCDTVDDFEPGWADATAPLRAITLAACATYARSRAQPSR